MQLILPRSAAFKACTILGLSLAMLAAAPVPFARAAGEDTASRSMLGDYLAGRLARSSFENTDAAGFFDAALTKEPGNDVLLRSAFRAEAANGNLKQAIVLAEKVAALDASDWLAQVVLAVRDFRKNDLAAADARLKGAATVPVGELTSLIARAWVTAAGISPGGEAKPALDLLESPRQSDITKFYLRFHRALIADVLGRHDIAATTFDAMFKEEPRSLRVALAYARHAAATGDAKAARAIVKTYLQKSPEGHPLLRALQKDLDADRKIALAVETPAQGLAEEFHELGELLTNDGSISIASSFLHLSLALQPSNQLAQLALANIFELTKKYDSAITMFDKIPADSPLASQIAIRKAVNLNSLDQVDSAEKLLVETAKLDPADSRPYDALGTILRARKKYEEAANYYTKAISLLGKPEKKHWAEFYYRGMCYERMKNWPAAEADLIKSLELAPDEPLILNYLGYSWVDQNKNLKKGMELIGKAVQKKPDDGYFVDSLGWAHFRQGNFKDAARFLERAVELRPEDPTINDHLGDAFWRVGRTTEARYQWEQALSLKPEPEDVDKIKEKMAKGLPPLNPEPAVSKKQRDVQKGEATKRRTVNSNGNRPIQ